MARDSQPLACSRMTRFSTFPDGLRGSASTKRTARGVLNLASRARQNSSSSSAPAVIPARSTTNATGTSPQRGAGRPTTEASRTAACS